eukprot:GEZU01029059.1.p2 GENE.GEZU01029059.1~~GEZU01029059.1.p2  ORF type:complete len:177 (-),score=64.91 GEZU01029059.1:59-589(-)
MSLTDGGIKIRDTPNAGGTSVISEVLSFELMNTYFNAALEATEMEIKYFPYGSKKTDYSARVGPYKTVVGVSVTRAFEYLISRTFDAQDAYNLLTKKLTGVIWSTHNNVTPGIRWEKQILHVWTPSMKIAKILHAEYRKLSASVRSNTVVLVSVIRDAPYIFTEGSNIKIAPAGRT